MLINLELYYHHESFSFKPAMSAKAVFFTLILFCCFYKICCDCRESYLIFCDCVPDLKNYKNANWTDVIIDSSKQTCSSSFINSNSFDSLDEIKLLFLIGNVNDIEKDTFKTIGQTLKILKFYDNNLNQIKHRTFSGFRKLSRLSLTNNFIKSIEGFAFAGSVIKNVDLSNNELETIMENTFSSGKITAISVRNNKLTYIHDEAFNEHLEVLRLDYNNLEYIKKGFITNLPHLKELSVSHNRISQVSDIKSLENLRKLNMAFNNINFIDSAELEDLKKLVYLDLSSNKLETLSLKIFKKVETERLILLLTYNQLTNIKIPDNPKPMTLTFFGNPFNCRCLNIMEQKMISNNFATTKCNLELFRSGTPICVEQGECENRPVEIREDLRRFMNAIDEKKKNLSCDLFQEVRDKHIVNMTAP